MAASAVASPNEVHVPEGRFENSPTFLTLGKRAAKFRESRKGRLTKHRMNPLFMGFQPSLRDANQFPSKTER